MVNSYTTQWPALTFPHFIACSWFLLPHPLPSSSFWPSCPLGINLYFSPQPSTAVKIKDGSYIYYRRNLTEHSLDKITLALHAIYTLKAFFLPRHFPVSNEYRQSTHLERNFFTSNQIPITNLQETCRIQGETQIRSCGLRGWSM